MHQFALAFKVADARAVKFLHLVHESAVDQVERLFGVHAVRAFKVAERHQRLVFEQAQNAYLAHDGGVELGLLLGGFGIACGGGLFAHGQAFYTVLHDLGVFLLVHALCPADDQDSAAVIVEIAACIVEVELVDHVSQGKVLRVAVADLLAVHFKCGIVGVDTQAHEQHLEQILRIDGVAFNGCPVNEQRNVFGLVAEHQVRVVVLAGDTCPVMPEGVFDGPGVAERGGVKALHVVRRKFRAFACSSFAHAEVREEFLPFVLEFARLE